MESTKFLTASLLAAGLMAGASTAHAGLVAHWSFDSDFTADTGGSGYDLTAVSGATAGVAGGQFGNAASFSRASSQYAHTGGDVLQANSDFSYSAWFNFGVADVTDGSRYFVLETTQNDAPSGDAAWTASLGLRDLTTATAADDLQVFTHPAGSVGVVAEDDATAPWADGVWQNVVVTYDADGGTFNDGIMNAYLNGTLFATADNITTTAVSGLVIGGHRAGTGRNFEGLIDDVAFFDNVLSSNEITALQSVSASQIPEPGSLALLGLGGLAMLRRRR